MMKEIVVDYPWRKTFVSNAFVKVNQTGENSSKEST